MSELVTIFVDLWKWDIAVLCSPWLYAPFLIPFCVFVPLMVIKWVLVTMPIWLPLYIIASLFKK